MKINLNQREFQKHNFNRVSFNRVSSQIYSVVSIDRDAEFVGKVLDTSTEQTSLGSSHSRGGSFEVDGVICKSYRRGGVPGRFFDDQHFNCFLTSRSYLELFWTNFLYAEGVRVPKPVFSIEQQFKWYRKMYYGSEKVSFKNDLQGLLSEEIAYEVGREVVKILSFGVAPTDLHPAQVLCLEDGGFLLVDFDKVVTGKDVSADAVIQRWNRACAKRSCEQLIKPFTDGVRS